jgi:hypothetical protein
MSPITYNKKAPLFYMFDDDHEMTADLEVTLLDQTLWIEATWVYYALEHLEDDDGPYAYVPRCNEIFEFRAFSYPETDAVMLTDVTDQLTDFENQFITSEIREYWISCMGE